MLEIKNITVCYGDRPTVSDFSMNLKQGQIASLVGESGSGKTTVIRAVLGLLPGGGRVSEGDILFDGKSLLQNTPMEWRKLRGSEISMIFQDSGAMLNPIRRIGDGFVEYIRTHEEISKQEAWKKGTAMLEKMRLAGAENIMQSYPFQLSGGEPPRVAIASVLTMQPEILALDEPTSNLDPISTERIFQVIAQLNREMGTTVLLVEHEIELLAQYATRILVVHDGAILLDGTPQEVFSRRDIFDSIGLEVPQVTQIAACAGEEYGLWTGEALPITMEQFCRRIRGDESGNED